MPTAAQIKCPFIPAPSSYLVGSSQTLYPPPQFICLSRSEPALLSQRWKQSRNSTFHISHVNAFSSMQINPFPRTFIWENINNIKMNRIRKKDGQKRIQSYQFSLFPFSTSFSELSKVGSWTLVGRSGSCSFYFLVGKQLLEKKMTKTWRANTTELFS